MGGQNFIRVNVNVGGKMQEIMMEKGTSFSNNGGEYCVFDDGTLKFKPTKGNVWQDAKQIEMKKYQWQVFQNVSDNDGDVNTYSRYDIEDAMGQYRNSEFTADIQQDLPEGFKISKQRLDSYDMSVQADVRMSQNVGATLRFADRGWMRDEVADKKLYDSYDDVTVTMPDIYEDGKMLEYNGRGLVTTKDGMTTTTIYWAGAPEQPNFSVTKDENGRIVSSFIDVDAGNGHYEQVLTNYTYNDAGKLTSRVTYRCADGGLSGDGTKVEHYPSGYKPEVEIFE